MRASIKVSLLGAALLSAAATAHAQTAPRASLEEGAHRALGLEAGDVVQLRVTGDPGERIDVHGVVGGRLLALSLQPHSVLAEDFRLLEQRADGSVVEAPAEPPRTYRGVALGSPGSRVAASLLDDGLHARILTGVGEFWIEPLAGRVPGAVLGDHALYAAQHVSENGGLCGTDTLENKRPVPFVGGTVAGQQPASSLMTAELGCDADYEYYLDYGSTGAVQNRITSVINTMNLQYESEVSITHQITTILVRTSSSQPYTSTDAVTLLNQFRSEWNANQGGVQRDLAQLFTGKEINGGTIGIAWLGVVCNLSYAYGVVQSDFNNNFSCATDLSAHEAGHNWNADHCSCTSNTMNPYITCANTFHPTATIPEIEAFRDSRGCLEGGAPPPPPPPATTMHVDSIAASLANAGKGAKRARATVVIRDDQGGAVAGATVTVDFTGTINETVSGTTGSDGSVTLTSNGSARKKVKFTACVSNVAHATLAYDPASNNQTCASN